MAEHGGSRGLGSLLRIQAVYESLGKAEQRVASFVLANTEQLIYLPITELAERARTSEATVVRVCKKAGFRGFQDLKIHLAQEIVSPLESIHEDIREGDDAKTVLSKVFGTTIQTLQYTLRVVGVSELEAAVDAIAQASVVDVYGLGNSAAVAVDFHHKLSRSGVTCRVATDNHLQMIYASTIGRNGVAVGISHSGSSRDVVEAMEVARGRGSKTMCITNYGRSPITKVSDICLFTASEETRFRILGLASRISQLAIIDTVHTLLALRNMDEFRNTTRGVLDSLQRRMY